MSNAKAGSAKEARVADFIDLLLSESEEQIRAQWFNGLDALDTAAMNRFGSRFSALDAAGTDALLAAISRCEREPSTPLEFFP